MKLHFTVQPSGLISKWDRNLSRKKTDRVFVGYEGYPVSLELTKEQQQQLAHAGQCAKDVAQTKAKVRLR